MYMQHMCSKGLDCWKNQRNEGGEAEEMTEVGVTYDSMQDVLYARSK